MIKSPINWVGNKYKHLDKINELVKGKAYDKVFDLFMGSGNIILNVKCKARKYAGNDINKLVPTLYNEIIKYTFSIDDIEMVLEKHNRFSSKDDYYFMREKWNKKFINDKFNKLFVIETILLLKMCSNSMVRFNSKTGEFNQGFRGMHDKDEFFTDKAKESIAIQLNELSCKLRKRNFVFTINDFKKFKDKGENNLLILDPPYILSQHMYNLDFTADNDNLLLKMIKDTSNDFIYFNYIKYDDRKHRRLISLLKNMNGLKVININDKTVAGQNRGKQHDVKEVMITNIKNNWS